MRSLARVLLAPLTAMLVLSACTSHVYMPYSPGAGSYRYVPVQDDRRFAYGSVPEVALEPAEVEEVGYEVFALSYQSVGDNGQPGDRVDALYYRSLASGPQKLVLVLPIWGTHTYPSEKITSGYARHSAAAAHIIRVLGVDPLFDWEGLGAVEDEAEFVREATLSADRIRTTVIDLRRLLSWAGRQPEIDASRVALVGFSMGAVVAALVLGSDPRVDTGVLMMGGAHPGDILAYCAARAGAMRASVLQRFGWMQEQFHSFFTELLADGDPARYAGHYNPAQILMIDAARDDCMPESSREALWEATGRPERLSFLYAHKGAFLSMTPLGFNFTRSRIYEFLDNKL